MLYAYSTELPLRYLGIDQGLSNNSVTTIFQDHYGFMWFGTYDGLNRYDGYDFKIFKNKWGDDISLINNHVICMAEDHSNRVWVGYEKGLLYYNYTDSKLHPVFFQPKNKKFVIKITSRINSIVTDAAGTVYIASEADGLLIYERGSNVCRQVVNLNNTKIYDIQKLMVDKHNQIWLFINSVGLCRYNNLLNKMVVVNTELPGANCLIADVANKNIWIGCESGLYSYSIAQNKITNFNTPLLRLTNKNIMSLHLDKTEKLWIGTDGGGINILDQATGKVTYMLPDEKKGSLSSATVYDIYEDHDSRKWIATLRGGLNVIDNKTHQFKIIDHDPQNKNSLVNNFIRAFFEDTDKNIWIGTSGGGLSYWNPKLNTYTNYGHNEANPTSLSNNLVTSILGDYKNNIWVTTFGGGINLYNKAKHNFKHYTCQNLHTEDRNTWRLFQDSHANLWVSTTRGGALYRYNRAMDKFEMFDNRLINVNCFFEDKEGNLWAGTNSDIVKIDVQNKQHLRIPISSAILSLHEDRRGNFWIGTDGGGIILFDRKKQKILKRYTETDGLTDNVVISILEDNSGFLWLSTYHGLCKFNPDLKEFKNYYASDGLQSNQFNYNAAVKLQSGEFLFGGIKGFNLFNPDSIRSQISTPEVFLTGFRVNNVPIEQDSAYGGKGAANLQSITIPYDKAIISVEFVAVEYSFPDKISYSYYLEGWDHAWNNSGKIKVANYSRINEGNYTLRIRATNSDGVWAGGERTINIKVLPPWYRAWWAWLIYINAIIALIYYYMLYKGRQTKLKYEVEIANLKIEKEKEINEKKLSFFTNVSHEFRTPLTLIINPIKDLLRADKENNDELHIVYRNARRLLGLVDHLLLFRKTESENADLKISKVNFTALCMEVYTCFTHQAKIKQISYTFESIDSAIEMYVDREKIEIALFNLISNAVKFTPDGGTINICIKENDSFVYFEIADNGIGINADVGEKLFDKFYQAKDVNSLKTGFGIGLYLVKTFIENHSGTIDYKTTSGGGTTFTLCLPKGKSHLSAYQISESAAESYNYAAEELIDHDNMETAASELAVVNLPLLISDQQSVLIIDDNQEIRAYIKKIFAADYVVFEADNGELGLELIKKQLPDVIISDIVMPGLSGLELCRLIKQDSALSHIPVILLTGESAPAMRLQGIEEGAVDFISKPFDKDLLLARVKGTIKNKKELQNYFFSEVTLKGKSRNISEEHKDFLYRCIEIIEDALIDPELDVNGIADKMGMSYSGLYKRIRLVTGYSLNAFIRFVRLRKAAELLINTRCNVNEAAFRTGFNDIKYFRENFHKQFGLNPSEFIKRHRGAFQKSYSLKVQSNQNYTV